MVSRLRRDDKNPPSAGDFCWDWERKRGSISPIFYLLTPN